ncbi:hypothetical protein pm9n_00300 [Pasteurella multocida]|nr:hypothetical protein pm9n_00300 [Pasteurella multocida]TCH95801.1 hypothetical protein E0F65_01245 [Pasteurella multocida]
MRFYGRRIKKGGISYQADCVAKEANELSPRYKSIEKDDRIQSTNDEESITLWNACLIIKSILSFG